MSVIVLGSINMDMVVCAEKTPAAGETIMGSSFAMAPGGKGANQAVACSLAGADVKFVGRVGDDEVAAQLVDSLQKSQVCTDYIIQTPGISSGVAQIIITADSQNRIIVIPGANFSFDSQDINNLSALLEKASSLLLQFEIPMSINITAARLASNAGVRVILDPAPATEIPDELLANVDIITPNQAETQAITGIEISNLESAEKAIKNLSDKGVSTPIIKMGAEGVCWMDNGRLKHQPSFKVEAIDTVAAGDAFNGGLAAALDEGKSLAKAVTFAQATAAICVTRRGAQQAMGDRKEIESIMIDHHVCVKNLE